jgi:hypothetical protein
MPRRDAQLDEKGGEPRVEIAFAGAEEAGDFVARRPRRQQLERRALGRCDVKRHSGVCLSS